MSFEKAVSAFVRIEQPPFSAFHSFDVDIITIIVVHSEHIFVSRSRLYRETATAIHKITMRTFYPRIDDVSRGSIDKRKGVLFAGSQGGRGCLRD